MCKITILYNILIKIEKTIMLPTQIYLAEWKYNAVYLSKESKYFNHWQKLLVRHKKQFVYGKTYAIIHLSSLQLTMAGSYYGGKRNCSTNLVSKIKSHKNSKNLGANNKTRTWREIIFIWCEFHEMQVLVVWQNLKSIRCM